MNTTVRKLTHSALMIALALILSMFKLFHMPFGGSVTIASMAPIIIISLMYDTKWALFTSFAYSLVQMVEGFYPPPVQNFWNYLAVVLLDYVIAFGVLGLAGAIARRFSNKQAGAAAATIAVIGMRFFCSFLSGILIWTEYAPEGMPVWLYSLSYNGMIMVGEMVVTVIAVCVIVRYVNLQKLAGASAT
ncbi:energy-coupled thiamine transporter ThiT [Anaerotruncus rubiinfantis]|uniref:energy-coupled thiamine transporter ThiT n=1 Tax=Anaerotruncus rubiinfantis TaxID=1720200 RepID=UPI0034A0E134